MMIARCRSWEAPKWMHHERRMSMTTIIRWIPHKIFWWRMMRIVMPARMRDNTWRYKICGLSAPDSESSSDDTRGRSV